MNKPLAVALGLALGGWAAAADPFRLGEPEIYKINWGVQALRAADIDGDGKTDLAVINNTDGRIELFLQLAPGQKPKRQENSPAKDHWEPVVDDSRFERVKIFTSGGALDLAVGDLNADGKPDLVYTNDRDEIVVHLQGKDGDWSQRTVHEPGGETRPNGDTMWIGDYDGDKANDLVVMGKAKLHVYPKANLKDKPRSFPLPETAVGLLVEDANGDGLPDLLYTEAGESEAKANIVLRLQNARHGFVEERAYAIDRPTHSVQSLAGAGPGLNLVGVSEAQHTVQRYRLRPAEGEAAGRALFQASGYAAPNAKEAKFVVGDFNGDKRADVVASDGPGAQVWLFLQNERGQFDEPESFPAFADITAMAAADVNGDGRAELIVASGKESSVGLSRYGDDKRLSYPDPLPVKAMPLSVAATDLDGKPGVEILCLTEGKSSRDRQLVVVRAEGDGWKADEPKEIKLKAQELRVADANQDGKADLLLLSTADAVGLLLQKADGGFADVDAASAPGLGDKIPPSAVSLGDFDGDGKQELLVSRNNYARCARLGADGKPHVVDQVNAPESSANLLVSQVVDLDQDHKPELLLVDGASSKIHVMRRDEKGVFRHQESHPGLGEITGSLVTDANGDGRSDLFLFTKTHFWWRPFLPGGLTMEETRLHATDLKDMSYNAVLPGDLDGDGKDDLALFDNVKSYVAEFLLTEGGSEQQPYRSAMHFKIFERDPHFRGQEGSRAQPHEVIVADLNADGRKDLVMLLHDRVLIYAQSAKPAGA